MASNLIENMKNNLSSLDKWDPFYFAAQSCPVLNTPLDWKETSDQHIFMVDLPSVKKEDVKIEVDDGRVLQISGDRGGSEAGFEAKVDDTWHQIERNRGKFCRRFQLPESAKTDEIKANMEDGVLKVIVPKQEVKKPEKKVIEIEEK